MPQPYALCQFVEVSPGYLACTVCRAIIYSELGSTSTQQQCRPTRPGDCDFFRTGDGIIRCATCGHQRKWTKLGWFPRRPCAHPSQANTRPPSWRRLTKPMPRAGGST